MNIAILPLLSDNFAYVLSDSKNAYVVDPSESSSVLSYLKKEGLQLKGILNTHHHWDHTDGNLELVKETGCSVYGSKEDGSRIPGLTHPLEDGDEFEILGEKVRVIEASGHTLGHILFYVASKNALFSGDTLFSLGCGRMFEGKSEQMWESMKRIRSLPDETLVYFGHEYTLKNGSFQISIEGESSDLESYLSESNHKIENGGWSSPSVLSLEKKLNLFLRADEPKVKKLLGIESASDHEVFGRLRQLKDRF